MDEKDGNGKKEKGWDEKLENKEIGRRRRSYLANLILS